MSKTRPRDKKCFICGKPSYGTHCNDCFHSNKRGKLSALYAARRRTKRLRRERLYGCETSEKKMLIM